MFRREPDDFDLMPMERRRTITFGLILGGFAIVLFGAALIGVQEWIGVLPEAPLGTFVIVGGMICAFVGEGFGNFYLYCAACGRRMRIIPWHRCPRCGAWLWGHKPHDLRD